ncbi:MAG: transcription antitermination factor NusB [Candidatus Marinimicrobia bacterium]|nr:transcription antitermination factor NusB [Candidatus Neomarinimicrobiota bacterium]
MANRHLSRSIAMQVLFEWDFNNHREFDVGSIMRRNIREFAPGLEDSEFVEKLVKGVLGEKKKIDNVIGKTAPEWPIEQIAIIDRNVLRIGLYELIFGNPKEVPPKVAINEAIELAKTFGGETSGKFVNGVLGTVYKEMGEPGKDDFNKASNKPKEILVEKLGGAVVYREENNGFLFALVHDIFGYWTLSKGRIEEGEDAQKGTIREIKEELGIDIVIQEDLDSNEYIASHPEKGQVKKQVTYFLAKTEESKLKLGDSGGLDDARWFTEEELMDLKIYDDLNPILVKAIKILKK